MKAAYLLVALFLVIVIITGLIGGWSTVKENFDDVFRSSIENNTEDKKETQCRLNCRQEYTTDSAIQACLEGCPG